MLLYLWVKVSLGESKRGVSFTLAYTIMLNKFIPQSPFWTLWRGIGLCGQCCGQHDLEIHIPHALLEALGLKRVWSG